MSRENFGVKLTTLNNETVTIMIHNIFAIVEVAEVAEGKDKKPAHTLVSSITGFNYEVKEKAKDIQTKAASYGTFKIME